MMSGSPEAQAKAFDQCRDFEDVVFLVGLESDQNLWDRLVGSLKTLVILEPDPSRRQLFLAHPQVSLRLDKHGIFVGSDLEPEALSAFLYSVFSRRDLVGPAQIAPWIVAADFDRRCGVDSQQLILRAKQDLKGLSTLFGWHEDGIVGLKNIVQNVEWIKKTPGLDRLRGVLPQSPAVVVATGPSLTKSLPILKQIQDRVVLIAADASLKILLKAGITPHFVCVIERLELTKPFLENLEFPDERRPHLIVSPLSHPEIMGMYPGPQWMAYRHLMSHLYFESFFPRGFLQSRHSVAHLCTALAKHLGCSEVALVGQDLCFDPETLSSHASNVAYAEWTQGYGEADLRAKLEAMGDNLYWLSGNVQERVPTRALYVVFAREYWSLQQELQISIVNATEGGLKIPGLVWAPLGDKAQSWTVRLDTWNQLARVIRTMRSTEAIDFRMLFPHLESLMSQCDDWIEILGRASGGDLRQARALWLAWRGDHSAQAFGFEIMGRAEVGADMDWYRSWLISSVDKQRDAQRLLLKSVFEGLRKAFGESLQALRQIDPDAAHRQKFSAR